MLVSINYEYSYIKTTGMYAPESGVLIPPWQLDIARGSESLWIPFRAKNLKRIVLHRNPEIYNTWNQGKYWAKSKNYYWLIEADNAWQYSQPLSIAKTSPKTYGFRYFKDATSFKKESSYGDRHDSGNYQNLGDYVLFGNRKVTVVKIRKAGEPDPAPETPQDIEPPTIQKEKEVTTCLFDEEKIKKLIRSLKAKIEVPVVEAIKKDVNGIEIWVPKINRTQIEVLAIDEATAASMALIYRKIAEIQIDLIKMRNTEPPIAVIPEWWQVRIGSDRPQLVCLYAEKKSSGKLGRSRWPLTIPHYIGSKKPQLPTYRKGQWEGILTLKDNSKVIINAVSKEESERVLNAIRSLINPAMLVGAQIKVGLRKGEKLKQCLVVPSSVRFFKTGQKNTAPDWVASLVK